MQGGFAFPLVLLEISSSLLKFLGCGEPMAVGSQKLRVDAFWRVRRNGVALFFTSSKDHLCNANISQATRN